MWNCLQSGCSWQAIAPSAEGARNAYLRHIVDKHTGADDVFDVEWFEKPPGEISNRRSHEHEQIFIILDGAMILHTDDDSIELSTGDSVPIEARARYHSENPGERACVGIRTSAPGFERANGR